MQHSKIAFTSCARFNTRDVQTVWKDIETANPDYLILLGDTIYMDFGIWPFFAEYSGKPRKYSLDEFESIMRRKYIQQFSEPNFASLIEKMREKNGLLAVWDDHDFAWNNAYGADPDSFGDSQLSAKMRISRDLFHEFLNCAPKPPELFGAVDTPMARIILLDNRTYATPLTVDRPVLMGDAQMSSLKGYLDTDLSYTLICGGLTLNRSAERWNKYTEEYNRFKDLVYGKKGIIYLGGDIHKNAFDVPTKDKKVPCYQIVSSGASIRYLGLPFEFDVRKNWTMLVLCEKGVSISQHSKKDITYYYIDKESWDYRIYGATGYAKEGCMHV